MPSSFTGKVLNKIKEIPKGRVSTYRLVAEAVGNSKAARAVGNALNKNPCPASLSMNLAVAYPIKIPCHRVVRSNGEIGGYRLGITKKKALLRKEGIKIEKNKIVDLKKYIYQFK